MTLTSSSYVTMVAAGEKGRPIPVPPVCQETKEERRRYQEGKERAIKRQEHGSKAG